MEYVQLQTFVFVLMSICCGIVSIGGAAAAVVKFWKWAHKDSDKNTEDIEALKSEYEQAIREMKEASANAEREYMTWFASDKRRIEGLETDFEDISDQNFLLMQAVVAIMDHQLDGNNTDKLEEAKNDVDKYLLENVKSKKKKRREEE